MERPLRMIPRPNGLAGGKKMFKITLVKKYLKRWTTLLVLCNRVTIKSIGSERNYFVRGDPAKTIKYMEVEGERDNKGDSGKRTNKFLSSTQERSLAPIPRSNNKYWKFLALRTFLNPNISLIKNEPNIECNE